MTGKDGSAENDNLFSMDAGWYSGPGSANNARVLAPVMSGQCATDHQAMRDQRVPVLNDPLDLIPRLFEA